MNEETQKDDIKGPHTIKKNEKWRKREPPLFFYYQIDDISLLFSLLRGAWAQRERTGLERESLSNFSGAFI